MNDHGLSSFFLHRTTGTEVRSGFAKITRAHCTYVTGNSEREE